MALKKLGRLDEAADHLRQALELDARHVAAHNNLGDVLTLLHRPREALTHLQRALELDPNCVAAHNNLGVACKELDRPDDAHRAFRRALELDPHYFPALNNLGNELFAGGQISEGTDYHVRALALEPDNVASYYALSGNSKHAFSDEALARMNSLLARPQLAAGDRELLHFALTQIDDRLGCYDEAFAHAQQANQTKKQGLARQGLAFDPLEHERLVDDLIATFTPELFARFQSHGVASELPVFIVGMPRSGTTLVEQILSSHPQAHGAGELGDLEQLVADLPAKLGTTLRYPKCVPQLDRITGERVAQAHLDSLRQRGGAASRVIDKMTVNFLHLGLIALLFPRARIIHCRREPRDTCLSCYFHNFASPGLGFAFDLGDLGFYYRQYQRLMEHWEKVLPIRVHHLDYEELVADQEKHTRELLGYCGLEWDERCLAFHQTRRVVKTASALQVREPIYRKSVGRWQPYEKHLGPLLEALAGATPPSSPPVVRSPAETFDRAVRQHQAGRWDEAEAMYQEILQAQPNHADALHLLGVLAQQRGRPGEAVERIRQALALNDQDAAYHSNLGIALRALGRSEEAVSHLQQAVKLNPGHAAAHKNLGVALNELGRLEEAATHLEQAHELMPGDAGALEEPRPGTHEATPLCRGGPALRGSAGAAGQRPRGQQQPGAALKELGRLEESIAHYRRAVELRPDFADGHNNLGIALSAQKQHAAALAAFDDALKLRPDFADALHNRAVALGDLDRFEEALAAFETALRHRPQDPETHNALGAALQARGRVADALQCFERVLELDPQHVWGHFNRGQIWLLQGDYPRGWPEYEWRWRRPEAKPRPFTQPEWDGSPRPEQTILLHAEQGLGDTLQFCRYAAAVKQRLGRVILECQPPLVKLLASCPGIDQFVPKGNLLPEFHVHAPLMSLPRILGTMPAAVPYLFADAELVEQWRRRLAEFGGLKIGINWQGNPGYNRDRQRSLPLAAFAPLAKVPGVTLFSLQKGPGQDQQRSAAVPVVDLGEIDEAAGAFMDSAAIMKNLDLVITSDTAIPHLAGALGVPAWLAVPFTPDWRWLLHGDDSPWYPTLRLFRQAKPGDWEDVFARMARQLEQQRASGSGCTVPIEIAPGELIDKITILQIKSERASGAEKLRNIRTELDALVRARDRCLPGSAALNDLTAELKAVNEALWQVEDDLRLCEQAGDFGPRFVELARSVYQRNDHRAVLKRQINQLMGSRFFEEKSYSRQQ